MFVQSVIGMGQAAGQLVKEIKDVLALLRLVQNPFDSVAFARAVNNTPLGNGVGAKTRA